MKILKYLKIAGILALLVACTALLSAWDMQRGSATPIPESWYQGMPIPEATTLYSAAQCNDDPDGFYVIGGGNYPEIFSNNFFHYDVISDTWSTLKDLPAPECCMFATCYQGKIYVAGGWSGYARQSLYIYDIALETWSSGADLPRSAHTAALGAWDGKLYLVGGSPYAVASPPVPDVDIYDIASNTWSAQAGESMPVAASFPGAVQAGQYLYLTGGLSGSYAHNIDVTQRYDMANDEWDDPIDFPSARDSLALALTEHTLYAVAGDPDGGVWEGTNLVESLDLTAWPSSTWQTVDDPLPISVFGLSGYCTEALTGGAIWTPGGGYYESGNPIIYDTNYYRPTGELCYDFYFGGLPREEWELGNHPGAAAHYVLPVVNDGTQMDTYDISVSSTWIFTAPTTLGPISPGMTDLLMVDVLVPADAEPDDFDTAVITVTSQGDPNAWDSAVLTTSVTDWQEAASVPEPVAFQSTAHCPNDPNGFYILGGSTPDLVPLDAVYYYNATNDEWKQKTSLPNGGTWVASTTCYDNKLYLAGGAYSYGFWVYDINADTWSQLATPPRWFYGTEMGVWDGKLYFVGGYATDPFIPTDEVNIYDTASNTWSLGPVMPVASMGYGSTQAGQYMYVVGGLSGDWNHNLDKTYRLNMAIENAQWEEGPSFTSQRAGTALSVSESHLYAMAGDINGWERLDPTGLVEVLDLSQWPDGTWEDLHQPLPWALEANWGGFCTEAMTGGEVWSVGGASGTWAKFITIDDTFYLPISEPCVQNIVNLSDTPMHGEGKIGSTVTYTVDITNTGNIIDYYNLFITSELPANLPLSGLGPVEPGETISVTIGIEVSFAYPGEVVTSTVRVESLRDPNIMDAMQIFTTVLPTPKPELEPESLGLSGMYGETIAYTLTVTNVGNITDTINLTYTGNTWEVVIPVTSFELGMGESEDFMVMVSIPEDVQLGEIDTLILTAVSASDPAATDSSTLTTTAYWQRMLMPLAMKN